MGKFFYNFWIYILTVINNLINSRISTDLDSIYVIYFGDFDNTIYICENGEKAIALVNLLNELNIKLNKNHIKIFYGKASFVFKHKMVKILDLYFTFECTYEEKQKVYSYICDVPLTK